MTHDELENEIAKAISGAPFTTPRSLTKAQAVLAAIREAGFAIVPVEPTDEMMKAADAAMMSSEDFVRQMRDEWPDKQEPKP